MGAIVELVHKSDKHWTFRTHDDIMDLGQVEFELFILRAHQVTFIAGHKASPDSHLRRF
jgi:hypothetical protein